ncbi:hypothetical protein ACWOEY_11410 [Enterococcus sulfureus]
MENSKDRFKSTKVKSSILEEVINDAINDAISDKDFDPKGRFKRSNGNKNCENGPQDKVLTCKKN